MAAYVVCIILMKFGIIEFHFSIENNLHMCEIGLTIRRLSYVLRGSLHMLWINATEPKQLHFRSTFDMISFKAKREFIFVRVDWVQ